MHRLEAFDFDNQMAAFHHFALNWI